MPVQPTYPGVYVEEISSPIHTITGVATSIAVFVGRTPRGPLGLDPDGPATVTSFGDFTRQFGGLDVALPLTYAVRDFFMNGGSQAVIARLYRPTAPPPAGGGRARAVASSSGTSGTDTSASSAGGGGGSTPNLPVPVGPTGSLALQSAAYATAALPGSGATGVSVQAASPGSWAGGFVDVTVDHDGIHPEYVARFPGIPTNAFFNLTVVDRPTNQLERFTNVTLADTPDTTRRLDRVLARESSLVRAIGTGGTWPTGLSSPDDSALNPQTHRPIPITLTGGTDSEVLDASAYQVIPEMLDKLDLFNLLCIPPDGPAVDTPIEVYQQALQYCFQRRAMLIVDPPSSWVPNRTTAIWMGRLQNDLGLSGETARNAALYFPRVVESDPLREGQYDTYAPCGIIAGIMARTDVERGVWKAPAGTNASVAGIRGLSVPLTDADSGVLNALGINVLRTFPVYGTVLWGARTLRGADLLADDYKYLPVRRLTLFLEESLYRGLKWAVFEPNDEFLWAQIRLNVGSFMNDLFRQGAFQGGRPTDAYFVKCDSDTTTQRDIDMGVVNVIVGFAPLKPAEFVIIQIQQMAGQLAV